MHHVTIKFSPACRALVQAVQSHACKSTWLGSFRLLTAVLRIRSIRCLQLRCLNACSFESSTPSQQQGSRPHMQLVEQIHSVMGVSAIRQNNMLRVYCTTCLHRMALGSFVYRMSPPCTSVFMPLVSLQMLVHNICFEHAQQMRRRHLRRVRTGNSKYCGTFLRQSCIHMGSVGVT
jgi:hypothetical protein